MYYAFEHCEISEVIRSHQKQEYINVLSVSKAQSRLSLFAPFLTTFCFQCMCICLFICVCIKTHINVASDY